MTRVFARCGKHTRPWDLTEHNMVVEVLVILGFTVFFFVLAAVL